MRTDQGSFLVKTNTRNIQGINTASYPLNLWILPIYNNNNNKVAIIFQGFCEISASKTDADKADAILFHNFDYSPIKLPKKRNPKQRYVLWSLESPTNDYLRPEKSKIRIRH